MRFAPANDIDQVVIREDLRDLEQRHRYGLDDVGKSYGDIAGKIPAVAQPYGQHLANPLFRIPCREPENFLGDRALRWSKSGVGKLSATAPIVFAR